MSEVTPLRAVTNDANQDVIDLLEIVLGEAKRGRIRAVTITAHLNGRESLALASAGEVDVASNVLALEQMKLAILSSAPITYSEGEF